MVKLGDRHIGREVKLNTNTRIMINGEWQTIRRHLGFVIVSYNDTHVQLIVKSPRMVSATHSEPGIYIWVSQQAVSGLNKQPTTIAVHGGLILGGNQRNRNPIQLSLDAHGYRNSDVFHDTSNGTYWIRIGEQDGDSYRCGPLLNDWLKKWYNRPPRYIPNDRLPDPVTVEFVRKYGVPRPETCNNKTDWFVEITEKGV